jgi:predicted Zn-dependent protease with MMP-like domain
LQAERRQDWPRGCLGSRIRKCLRLEAGSPLLAALKARQEGPEISQKLHPTNPEFEQLVRSALDELPDEFQQALQNVAIVVSDHGAEHHAYGEYVGFKPRGGSFFGGGGTPDEILIFRDTLVRDFGQDPERLRAHVVQTVRHEVGHYFGLDDAGLRKLGL